LEPAELSRLVLPVADGVGGRAPYQILRGIGRGGELRLRRDHRPASVEDLDPAGAVLGHRVNLRSADDCSLCSCFNEAT
jgi:hypothetical protein